jgi:hypothetical protein
LAAVDAGSNSASTSRADDGAFTGGIDSGNAAPPAASSLGCESALWLRFDLCPEMLTGLPYATRVTVSGPPGTYYFSLSEDSGNCVAESTVERELFVGIEGSAQVLLALPEATTDWLLAVRGSDPFEVQLDLY